MNDNPPEPPRIDLRTLTRGDGLLGMRAVAGPPRFGPRGAQLTVVKLHGEASDAQTRALQASGLQPLPGKAVQWRHPRLAQQFGPLWSLPEEAQFGDFWAEQLPRLQALGWQVCVAPGFAHMTAPVQRWQLLIDPVSGAEQGRLLPPGLPAPVQPLTALRQPKRMGSWLLSLGVEVEGEMLDLTPMLAQLIKEDARWLVPERLAIIPDDETVVLRAPGGRRIEATAAPLKAIVASMLDLLLAKRRQPAAGGALLLDDWQAQRIEALRAALAQTQAQRAGALGQWQLQGDAGLQALAQRLRAAGQPPAVAAPAGLQLQLRSYQLQGLAWLQYLRQHHLAGILADEMGLGKTAQVLAHLLLEKAAGRLDRPALVVLPTTLVANWRAEAAHQAPGLRVLALQGPQRKRDFARIAEHDLVLTTYALLPRDLDSFKQLTWHLLVLDEAQFAKNATSRAASAARRLQARHRLALSGTPVENNLAELWAHFDLLMPGFLGDWRSFNRLWRRPIEDNGEQHRAELLAQRVRPFILRRRKEDVATELPPKTEVIRRVQLQGAQRALYESVRLAADEQVRRVLKDTPLRQAQIAVLDALLKLRQVCCDPRLVRLDTKPSSASVGIESAKLALLMDMLPGLLAQGRSVLVFSQFTALLALVKDELDRLQLPHLLLTGATPPQQRAKIVSAFQAGAAPLLLASLKAGGVGLNLTAADTVIHLDPWWNPAVQQQASARAHRIGQTRPVFVYQLVVEGSIEERMLALQARKAALAESVLGGGGRWKFSLQELQGLLAPLQ